MYFLQTPVVCSVHVQLNHSRGFQPNIGGNREVAAEPVFLAKKESLNPGGGHNLMPFNRFKIHFEGSPGWRAKWEDVVLASE